MSTIENFINIRDIQLNGNGVDAQPAFFSKSPIIFETVGQSKNSAESATTLDACVRAGLFRPESIVGENALRHEGSGLSFVEFSPAESQGTFNISAKVISPDDPRKFLESGDLTKLTDAKKVTIISGPCIFSAPSVTAHLSDGSCADVCDPGSLDTITSKVENISVDNRLQAYEADSVFRLTQVISAIDPSLRKVELALNVPRVEYYLYILSAYEKGLIEPDIASKWFELVDNRSQRMEGMIRKRVPQEFEIKTINPLNPIEARVKSMVEAGQKGLFEKIIAKLKAQSVFWKFAISQTDPKTFTDISNLSYVMANLMVTQDESTLPIAVENPEESPIFRNLKKVLDGVSIKMLLLYPHSNATPRFPTRKGKANNYFVQTPDNTRALVGVARLNRQK